MFPVFEQGYYRVQPVYVKDVAAQAAVSGSRGESFVADAAGTETFTFEELLLLLN